MKPSISSDKELLNLIQWHVVDTYVGLAGTSLCIPTLGIFLSNAKFFKNNKV